MDVPNNSVQAKTPYEQFADTYNISVDTIGNYIKFAHMIPELDDLVNTGVVTKPTAFKIHLA